MVKPFKDLTAFEKLKATGDSAAAECVAADIVMELNSERVRLDVGIMAIEKTAAHLLWSMMNALEKHGVNFDPQKMVETFNANVNYELGMCIRRSRGDEIL